MNKKLVGMLVGAVGLMPWSAQAVELKCYPNKEFMGIIEKENLLSIFNGDIGNNRMQEILVGKDRHALLVEYDNTSDKGVTAAKEYCVKLVINDVTFNESAVEYLNTALEKAKGQRT